MHAGNANIILFRIEAFSVYVNRSKEQWLLTIVCEQLSLDVNVASRGLLARVVFMVRIEF